MTDTDTRLRFTAGPRPLAALREAIAHCSTRNQRAVAVWVNPTIRDMLADAPLPVFEDANVHYWYLDLEAVPIAPALEGAQMPLFGDTAP